VESKEGYQSIRRWKAL